MKNLFKKLAKKETRVTIQKLEKNQLEKVVGGADETTTHIRSLNDSKKTVLNIIK
jgi:hypothetical protein